MRAHKIVLLAGSLLLAAGCQLVGGTGTEGTCPTYRGCGGQPIGEWSLSTGCNNLVVTPYQMPSLPEQLSQPQTATQAPPQPMPTTSGDWCSGLIYYPTIDPTNPIRGVILWHGPPTVHDGYVYVMEDGTYDAQVRFLTEEHTYFAAACLTRYETKAPSCQKLGVDLKAYLQGEPSFKFAEDANTICTGDSSVGCDCRYTYQVQAMEQGTWQRDPNTPSSIVFSNIQSTEPQAATFCQSGDTLQLSGDDGTVLFGALGVRSGSFTRIKKTAP